MAASCLECVVGAKCGSSERATSALKYLASISATSFRFVSLEFSFL